jgi:Kef-type K+ transport system membrane component KefB
LGAYLGSKFASRIITVVQRKGAERGLEESGFLLALSLAFLYAVISELIGISAIIGAFVAGTSFARSEFKMDFQKQIRILEWVFAPIFFLTLGILVDIRLMPPDAWIFAIILTIVALATKIIGCGIPARLLKIGGRESVAIGIGMAPRMEVAMIIGLYGLTMGIITRNLYSVIIMMGILTSIFTPSILRRMLKKTPRSQEPGVAVQLP